MASRLRITRLPSQLALSSPRPLSRLQPQISSRNATTRPSSSLPRVANTSVWTSMIPKFIRNRDPKASKSKEWNPATFFILIFLLIGSQAIKMLGLRNDFANFNRSADAKMELMREVIDRLGKGEKVDVERLIGAAGEEREWEEVLREIEQEDTLWRKSQEVESPSTEPSEQKSSSESPAKEPQEARKPDDEPPGGQKPRPFAFY